MQQILTKLRFLLLQNQSILIEILETNINITFV